MRPVRAATWPCQRFEAAHSFTLACMSSRHPGCWQWSTTPAVLHCRVANEFRAMRGRSRVEAMQLDLSNFR